MNVNSVTEEELLSWIEKSLNDNGLKTYKIGLTGKSEKGDGYMGEIVFASITGTTNENKKKTLHWVVKHAKRNYHLRSTVPMKAAFDNEIYIYKEIIPLFKQFQTDKNIQNGFSSIPKCYSTIIMNDMEVLILDNLKERGYELHDRKNSFNMCHLKAVLKEYGKLHALSFALREQRIKDFNRISDFGNDVLYTFINAESAKESIKKSVEKALNMLKDRNEPYLAKKLENMIVTDADDMLLNLMMEREPQSVIIHGDCWNNNFMFQYQNPDKTSPTNVAILDWQISALRSPVFDLSYLIYATSSSHELEKFDELLKFYYISFSKFLKELGSNPDEIFSYSSLEDHWRKYSLFGLLLVLFVFTIALCDKDDAPEFGNLKEGETIIDIISDVMYSDLYFDRMKAIVSHYFKCNSK